MSKHYKSVSILGNRIFHRYWDGKESKMEVVDSFPIELYVPGQNKDSTSIYGDNLNKIEFDKISEAKEFMRIHNDVMDIYGQTSLEYQFISRTYPGLLSFNISNFKICNLDIETKYDNAGFPSPKTAKHEITAITCKLFGVDGFTTFGVKGYKKKDKVDTYIESPSEFEMLAKFINWWSREQFDIITGWNVVGFDIPYLVNRLINVMGEATANKLSPFHSYSKKVLKEKNIKRGGTSYSILGISILDYIELYMKFAREKQESYRLDNIAEVELGEHKLDYSEYDDLMDMFERNYQKYIEYNIHDVRLVEDLDKKLQYMFLAITMGFVGKVNPDEIFGPVKLWDNIIYNELREKNIQIPPSNIQGEDDSSITGAYVIRINPGAYKWVISFDLTSLYPSLLMALNMSPETLAVQAFDKSILSDLISHTYDTQFAKDKDHTVAANGSQYTRDKPGVLAEVTARLFDNRVLYKKKMIAVEKEIELLKQSNADKSIIREKDNERAHYEAMQQAFKIALNSLYGAMGCPYFRYFDTNVAEGITLTGQYVSRRIGIRVNEYMNERFGTHGVDYLIAGDTDSVDGKSIINTTLGDIKIEDFWNKIDSEIVERGVDDFIKKIDNVKALAVENNEAVMKPVSYIMKHKVKKRQFRITLTLKSGLTKQVICTEDHSLQVERNGVLIEVSPKELKPTDVFIANV